VSGGALHQTNACAPDAAATSLSGPWTDLDASVLVSFDAACVGGLDQAGMTVRAQGTTPCSGSYLCAVDADDGFLAMVAYVGTCPANTTNFIFIPILTTGVQYVLSSSAVGGIMTCSISGGNLPQSYNLQMVDFTHPTGGVGVMTFGAAASFDDLLVTVR